MFLSEKLRVFSPSSAEDQDKKKKVYEVEGSSGDSHEFERFLHKLGLREAQPQINTPKLYVLIN